MSRTRCVLARSSARRTLSDLDVSLCVMSRTTPPRPADIAAVFPELAPLARTAVRLHPRPGAPTAADSSAGGPLLWPVAEPWPTCPEHTGPWLLGYTPDDLQKRRRLLTEGWARPQVPGTDFLNPDERAFVNGLGFTGARRPVDGPVPLLPVLQLYAHDLPSLPCPPGTALLQVLWCSFEHGRDCMPGVQLRWRSAGTVGPVSDAPAPPVVSEDGALPQPCLLHPEPVLEYPAPHELEEDPQTDPFLGGRPPSRLPVRPRSRPRLEARRMGQLELLRPLAHALRRLRQHNAPLPDTGQLRMGRRHRQLVPPGRTAPGRTTAVPELPRTHNDLLRPRLHDAGLPVP